MCSNVCACLRAPKTTENSFILHCTNSVSSSSCQFLVLAVAVIVCRCCHFIHSEHHLCQLYAFDVSRSFVAYRKMFCIATKSNDDSKVHWPFFGVVRPMCLSTSFRAILHIDTESVGFVCILRSIVWVTILVGNCTDNNSNIFGYFRQNIDWRVERKRDNNIRTRQCLFVIHSEIRLRIRHTEHSIFYPSQKWLTKASNDRTIIWKNTTNLHRQRTKCFHNCASKQPASSVVYRLTSVSRRRTLIRKTQTTTFASIQSNSTAKIGGHLRTNCVRILQKKRV